MEISPEPKPLPVPESRWERVLYALIVTFLPIACFSLSEVLKPEWQTGKFADKVTMLLLPETVMFFYPFMAYAVISMILLLTTPERYAQNFIIRFGIYTGTLLALHFAGLTITTEFAFLSVISAAVLIFGKWLYQKRKTGGVIIGVAILVLILVMGSLMIWQQFSFAQLPFLALIALLSASPFLCLAVAAITSVKLIKHYETKIFSFQRGMGLLAWLAAYGFAWRLSVLKAIEVYQSLPTQPPDCYIATAAARGHRSIVQSRPVKLVTGLLWINPQLQYLKCTELALMALLPSLHRPLRKTYDVVGKAFAKRMTNPFFADLAYLALKPLEWLAWLLLKALIPEIDFYVRRFYRATITD